MQNFTVQESLEMRRNYIGKSCKLHFEMAPMKIVRGSKQYLYDDMGNEYLDCISSVSHVGHCHPQTVHACHEQMTRLITSYGFLNDKQTLYIKNLTETLPESLSVCYFLNSGSEANDLALQLAWAYTKQKDVIVVDNAYHGNLSTLNEISPLRFKKQPNTKKPYVHIAPVPDTYRGIHRDVNSPGPTYAYEVKKVIDKIHEADRKLAAFLIDPTMLHSGVIIPPKKYLNQVSRYVRNAGGVMILDEVVSGLGRVGDHYWAFQAHDMVPDILTCGKPLGNGHPMSVVITTKEISDCLAHFSSSYGGNPVSCAIGISVLDVIKNERLLSAASSVGRFLMEGFKNIMLKHPMIGNIRGQGMILGIELVEDKESRKPAKDAAEKLAYKLKQRKILLGNDGPDKNVMIFTPPLCFTVENACHTIKVFDECLSEVEEGAADLDLPFSDRMTPMDIPLSVISGEGGGDDSDSDESEAKRARYEDVD